MIEFHDRTAYSVFALEIPRVRGRELVAAAKYQLIGLYPGDIGQRVVQVRKNGGKKWAYLVFVLAPGTGGAMLPLSPLFVQRACASKSANVLYVDRKWFEYIRIENGTLLSSVAKIRDDSRFADDVSNVCGDAASLTVYCAKTDEKLFDSLQGVAAVRFVDPQTELKNIAPHTVSLFGSKSPAVRSRRVFSAVAAMLALAGCVFGAYQHRKNERERGALQRIEAERLQKRDAEMQRETQRLADLSARYQAIAAAKTATPFDVAAVIADCAGPQTRILSATLNNGFFQIEGVAADSLGMLRAFERHRLVGDARLHQVRPLNEREAFTLSGVVKPEVAAIDAALPAGEQIAALEAVIAKEAGYAAAGETTSPSAFGEAATAVFAKWGCMVNGYQFMGEAQSTEIECSLRATGSSLFNALYDIKSNRRSWETRLVQIRNLYPRDALDAVVRIRAANRPGAAKPPMVAPPENAAPYPVANISRNYYAAASAPRPLATLPAPSPEKPQTSPSARAERAPWLEYVGSVSDEGGGILVYVKDARTGEMLKLVQGDGGDMRYSTGASGGMLAYIGGYIYEINRR